MDGLIVSYILNPEYFIAGEAYQFKINTNDFRIGIIKKVYKDKVEFSILDEGKMIDYIITVSDLLYHNDFMMVRMKPDYEDGKFKSGI